MYTIDDRNNDEYEADYVENSFWSNNKGLIVKIIIIILCIIVLIWLFKALKVKRNSEIDNSIHTANVEKIRLAAEDYFFIKGNKSDNNVAKVNLTTLKNEGLASDIVDANNKVCSENDTNATLLKDDDSYKMTVKLACSTSDREEEFIYHNRTLACLNCNGNTKMTGEDNKPEEKEVIVIDEGNKNDDYVYSVSNDESYEYSCANWSDWTKNRVSEPYLEERSKTLVRGVKYNNSKKVYGEWSEYTTTPIAESDGIEVETKVVNEEVLSDVMTSTDIDITNPNIRIISSERATSITNNNSSSCSGYVLDNKCYSNETKIGNLTFKEYNSGNYKVKKNFCEGVQTLKNSEGKYVLTYVNCEYNEVINNDNSYNNNTSYNNDWYTVYTYQELISQEVTYYRSRSIATISEEDTTLYTKDLYDEEHLPEGYIKLPGSEEVYYSYKIATCEK